MILLPPGRCPRGWLVGKDSTVLAAEASDYESDGVAMEPKEEDSGLYDLSRLVASLGQSPGARHHALPSLLSEMGDGIKGVVDLNEMSTRRWLIDGMNVIGSRPNGWWRDRRGAIQRFTEQVAEFVALSGDSATVVFDGKPFSLPAEVEVVFAPGGPNAADDAIVGIAADVRESLAFTVVTSDRELARRVHDRGVETLGASAFLRHLEETT